MKNGDVEGDYDFCATEKDNALNWKVAPSLDPASSADTTQMMSSMDNESNILRMMFQMNLHKMR